MNEINKQSLLEEWEKIVNTYQVPLASEIGGISVPILGREEYAYSFVPIFPEECIVAQKISAQSPQDLQKELIESYNHGQNIFHIDKTTYEKCFKTTQNLHKSLQDIPLENTSFFIEVANDLPQITYYLQEFMKGQGTRLRGVIGTPWKEEKETDIKILFKNEDIQKEEIKTVFIDGGGNEEGIDELENLFINLHEYLATFKKDFPTSFLLNQIVLKTTLSSSIFFELSKLRAIRHLFYHFAQHYQAEDTVPIIYVETKIRESIYEKEDGEFIGATLQAFAAITGGANYLHIDTNQGEKGRHLARNIYHILVEECKINSVKDPFAGAFAIEEMTSQLCEKVWEKFIQRIETKDLTKEQGV